MSLQTRRARILAGVLAALLLIGVGFVAGSLLSSLSRPGDASAEAGFARDMSVHHAQAVEMGMFAFRKAQDEELRIIGYDIATTQQFQIGMMKAWLDEWNLSPTSSQPAMSWMPDGKNALLPDGRMPGMATNEEINKLKAAEGKDFDVLFCQLMLRHHLGGVHMADGALASVKDERVHYLAERIRQGQTLEITTLTGKLKDLGAQPL